MECLLVKVVPGNLELAKDNFISSSLNGTGADRSHFIHFSARFEQASAKVESYSGIITGMPGVLSHAFQSIVFLASLLAKYFSKNALKSPVSIDLNLYKFKYSFKNGSNTSGN